MSNSSSTPPRISEPDFTKTHALATYVRSRIWTFNIWLEPEFHRPSNGTGPTTKIPSESMGIINTSGHLESVRVLCHRLLGRWPVYRVGAR
jgi:hypothetical protein